MRNTAVHVGSRNTSNVTAHSFVKHIQDHIIVLYTALLLLFSSFRVSEMIINFLFLFGLIQHPATVAADVKREPHKVSDTTPPEGDLAQQPSGIMGALSSTAAAVASVFSARARGLEPPVLKRQRADLAAFNIDAVKEPNEPAPSLNSPEDEPPVDTELVANPPDTDMVDADVIPTYDGVAQAGKPALVAPPAGQPAPVAPFAAAQQNQVIYVLTQECYEKIRFLTDSLQRQIYEIQRLIPAARAMQSLNSRVRRTQEQIEYFRMYLSDNTK